RGRPRPISEDISQLSRRNRRIAKTPPQSHRLLGTPCTWPEPFLESSAVPLGRLGVHESAGEFDQRHRLALQARCYSLTARRREAPPFPRQGSTVGPRCPGRGVEPRAEFNIVTGDSSEVSHHPSR